MMARRNWNTTLQTNNDICNCQILSYRIPDVNMELIIDIKNLLPLEIEKRQLTTLSSSNSRDLYIVLAFCNCKKQHFWYDLYMGRRSKNSCVRAVNFRARVILSTSDQIYCLWCQFRAQSAVSQLFPLIIPINLRYSVYIFKPTESKERKDFVLITYFKFV